MSKMQKMVGSLILRASLVVFLVLSGIVLCDGIARLQKTGMWPAELSPQVSFVVMVGAVLFFILVAFLGWYFLEHGSHKRHRNTTAVVFTVLVLLQLLILFAARPVLRHDALKVFDEALSMLKLGGVTPSHFDDYFMRYTNNNGMLLFTYGILKLAQMTGLLALDKTGGMLLMQLVNLIAIDSSLLIGLLFLRRLYGKQFEKGYLFFVLLCPLHYVWVGFYYTNTIAMPFFMLMLYLISLCIHQNQWPFSRMILIGICIAIGFYLRATNAIPVIATVIYLICRRKHPESGRHPFASCMICILAVVATVVGYQQIEKKYVQYDTTDSAFPTIHWVMMGMSGEGDFNQRDEMYTRSYATKEEKKNADKELLAQRLQELGPKGVVQQCIHKMNLTFADGTGNYPAELSMSDSYGFIYQLIYGGRRGALLVFCQASYLALMLLAMVGAIRLFVSDHISEVYLMLLSLTGAFLFHMLWEAGSIYSIGFMPLLYVGAAFGFEWIAGYFEQHTLINEGRKKRLSTVGVLLAVIGIGSVACTGFMVMRGLKQTDENTMRMNQFMFVFGQYMSCDETSVLTQTFETMRPFDTIEIMVHNPLAEANDSVYAFTVTDEDGTVVAEQMVAAKDCMDLTYQKIEAISEKGVSRYQVSIRKISGTGSLEFPYYGTDNYDIYKGGSLQGGTASQADLTMKVYLTGGR